MGNQLVCIASSQILPVEWYLKDHRELKFDISLGSTRFLKVARAESQEGPVVVKVFAIRDPSLPLQGYKDRLEEIRKKLSAAVNCTPYQKFILTDKAALLIREYVKYSLYDRISTRPFLTNIEKRWITFQILYALHQCHKVGVCHGDIKLENITVTSWNWVMLVDFASFKPTFLPIDNPGDYSYFFDTSRRRTCYIAPERFSNSTNLSSNESAALISETICDSGDLTPAMDIFSAGCALLELWNELHFPFDYSQLLAYKAGKFSPQKHLDKLEDPNLKCLISSMIDRDPLKRLTAEDYLDQHKGKLFPEYFYTFLQSYMLIFSANPIMSSDEKIMRLKGDIGNIFKFLGPVKKSYEDENQDEDDAEDEKVDPEKYQVRGESEGLVLITSLVTSCIRGLHECPSKLFSLEILLELAYHASDETILDRILPCLMFLAHDNSSRVKIAAINTITKCLDLVQRLPRSDANIFPEYILPELAPLATDPNACVRAAYAKNISGLAQIALRYLDQIQNIWCGEETTEKADDEHTFNYELELQALHEMVQQTVSALLTDSHSIVKQALINNGVNKLCIFFGKAKANDLILSHMITFLNDKEDTQLRKSFFDCIVGVTSYIGWHCSSILTPLLLQGLTDSSEFVIRKAILAMASLTEYNLVTTSALCELIIECSYFLVHPNLWIREAVCGFIAKAGQTLSVLDIQCKVMPHLEKYMKYKLIQIEKSELLLDSLVSPIPRSVYENVINYSDINQLMEVLEERKHIRDCINSRTEHDSSYNNFYVNMSSNLKSLFRRLEANGMTEQVEEYLLKMGHHLKKIHKYKSSADARPKSRDGKTDVDSLNSSVRNKVFHFSDPHKNDYGRTGLHRTNTLGSIDTNSDWNCSSDVLTRQSESTNSGAPSSRSTSSRPSSPPPDGQLTQFISTTTDASSLHEKSFIQYRRSTCYIELTKLKNIQQEHYFEALRNKEWAEQAAWKPQLPPPGWHPRGILVAHLHEHKNAVNRLCRFPDSPLFASSSVDGTVRVWDCSSFEAGGFANRSKQQFRLPNASSITGMTVCDGGQSLAVSSQNSWIGVLRVDPASSKLSTFQSRQLDPYSEGFAVDLQCLDPGTQSTVVYATLYGDLVGWDLRQPGVAWRLENGLRQGVITTFCIDTHQNWLALGTCDGMHTVWDLRFRLPITTINLPTQGNQAVRIRKVIPHPTEHSWLLSSVQGNNEISMWNLETGSRQKVLWGSTTPPLSILNPTTHSVCAMQAGCIDRSPFLLSGGTDQRLRFWNLESPSESYLALPAASDAPGTTLSYRSRLIDGTDVVYEEHLDNRRPRDEELPRAGPEPPAPGHKDCITDIALCKASQCFMVTASRDGVIKVSK
ncbi:phosphoinositide 3-kinase regulatory subunit 4 [Anthonomus grandis grandis]|uniref:phosphoinositide 3-kinase regulatory subunit 4 n=1 Tax=Anthonomus grandis grandis TaxID=2921223 RepID=UPI0021652D51|nr:phosphoinositide 3-kinase regulatory subunit 4 [Anthonomus grandis grandis]